MTTRRDRALFVLLGAVLLVYLVYPFVTFLSRTGHISVVGVLSSRPFRQAVLHSLVTAPVATGLAALTGVPLGYVLARSSFRGKRVVEALVVLPMVLPPVVGGAMLLTGFGRFTPVGALFDAAGIPLTNSLVGVVLAQTFVSAPFMVVTASAGFASIDPHLERASQSMGYGPLKTFRHVSLPRASGALFAGVVLTFARAMGEFGATMMVAYNPRTMPTQIWVNFISRGVDATVPLALTLLSVSLLVILAVKYWTDSPALVQG